MLVKIGRERHARRLNRVINDPSVYPWVHGLIDGPLDMSAAVANPNNVLLMSQHGGIFFHHHQPGFYEAHTQVLPEGRGEWCLAMTRAALHWMFTRTSAMEILTRVPKGNLAARALTKAAGLKPRFINPKGWAFNGKVVPAEVFSLTIQDWLDGAPGLDERGQWFAERLARRLGIAMGTPSPAYLRMVGAAYEMLSAGMPEKAMVLYNRWATLADHEPIAVVAIDPVAIKFGQTTLILQEDGDFYVATKPVPANQEHAKGVSQEH